MMLTKYRGKKWAKGIREIEMEFFKNLLLKEYGEEVAAVQSVASVQWSDKKNLTAIKLKRKNLFLATF